MTNNKVKQWFPDMTKLYKPYCYEHLISNEKGQVCVYCPLVSTFNDGKIHEQIVDYDFEGHIRKFRLISSPVRDSSGSIIYGIELIEDITDKVNSEILLSEKNQQLESANKFLADSEKALKNILYDMKEAHEKLKNTQKQLIQSEKLASIGQLAAGIAHEINNPVGYINSNLSTLGKYIESFTEILRAVEIFQVYFKDDQIDKAKNVLNELYEFERNNDIKYMISDVDNLLRETKEGVDRIKKIVWDLRTFSRADMGERKLSDINKIIEGILSIVWNEIKYKANLKKEYGEIPLIDCNPQEIGQVFINILVNAAQAIVDKGLITIKTYNDEEKVFIEISDTGIGMSEEVSSKVFDPFFTTKEVGKGTGLGLSISYDLVKKHNGDIYVKSVQGQGTTFTIWFPIIRR